MAFESFSTAPAAHIPKVSLSPEHASEASRRYVEAVTELAKDFIYNKTPVASLERRLGGQQLSEKKDSAEIKISDPLLSAFEQKQRRLKALLEFCRGVEAHELANKIQGGAWQLALVHQPVTHPGQPKPTETLTREEVAKEFAGFDLREPFQAAERAALMHYRNFLETSSEPTIPLSAYITLERFDIEALVNDLEVRMAERIVDEEDRQSTLLVLNRELLALIDRIPRRPDYDGKRFELQEIYLLRKLIQTADTGHLVSVNHGTPREDLKMPARYKGDRIEEGVSVDLVITFANRKKLELQIKTYKQRVSSKTLVDQRKELAFRKQTLRQTTTSLNVLPGEAVIRAFEAARNRRESEPTKLADKLEVFEPILTSLGKREGETSREREEREMNQEVFIKLLGLTEERCRAEQADFERREKEMKVIQERYFGEGLSESEQFAQRRKAIEDAYAEMLAAEEIARKDEELAKQKAEQEKRDRIEQQQNQDRLAAQRERDAIAAAKAEKMAMKRAQRERELAQQAKEAARLAEKEGKANTDKKFQSWSRMEIDTLTNVPMFKRFGIPLATGADLMNDLLDKKKQFAEAFPKKAFLELFPTKESFENPSEEAKAKVRERMKVE